jgi:hypothetical protein
MTSKFGTKTNFNSIEAFKYPYLSLLHDEIKQNKSRRSATDNIKAAVIF